MVRPSLTFVLIISAGSIAAATELGIDGTRFTLDGKPTFLLGVSYYGALGAPREFVDQDLDDFQRFGINWIRVWATWAAFDHDVTAVDDEGKPREPYFSRLRRLVAECDRLGMIVDVTLTRGNSVVGTPRIRSLETHRRAVETIVSELKPHRNWYLDLGNERNIRDQRHGPGQEPRRSFDMRERRLFEQLDEVEREALERLGRLFAERGK